MALLLGRSFNYKTVAASQTTAPIIGQGGYIECMTVVPASSTPGSVVVNDGSTALFTIPTGAGGDTKPYTVMLRMYSAAAGGFNITTGSCVSVIVSGNPPPRDNN